MRVLDLFSGIGGFSLGLEAAGFETAAFSEIEEFPIRVLKKHWPKVPNLGDITKLTKESIYERVGRIDCICGGFPCTDISYAGAAKGFFNEDGSRTRSGLWFEYLRLVKEIRPKFVIIENVDYLRKNGLGSVLLGLSQIGYDAEWNCISATDANGLHPRERLFIISYPSGFGRNQRVGERRRLSANEKRENKKTHKKGQECEFESFEVCPILSRGAFNNIKNTLPDNRAFVSSLRRVTNGVPNRLDEHVRKSRVKALGNSIVPQIAYLIGKRIMEVEKDFR